MCFRGAGGRCRGVEADLRKNISFLKREGKDKMSPQKNIMCIWVSMQAYTHKSLKSSAHLLLFQKSKILVKYL